MLSIGNFDGVHIGHRAILSTAKKIAAERNVQLVAMTFHPHPLTVLQPRKPRRILTPLEWKKHLLAESGVDVLFVAETTPELLQLSPADFVEQFLVENIRPSVVVEGEDFNFGAGRVGSIHTLYNLGNEKGFKVVTVESEEARLSIGHSVRVSSTLIRNLIEAGNVADAAIALAGPYRLAEKIIPGRGKGKKLGFPTLNLTRPTQLIPAEGVYAGTVEIADSFQNLCRC